MLVSELINRLQSVNRPNAEVIIDTRTCQYQFDEVTCVESADCVYLCGNGVDNTYQNETKQ
jgi:hypothetical protein